MDTRSKILSVPAPDAGIRAVVVGYFDPVTSANALRLKQLAEQYGNLLVIVTDPEDPILPLRARLELVAALRPVTEVVGVAPDELEDALESLEGVEVIREEAEDTRRTQDFIRHLQERQAAANA
ncbi:MAG TPA: hypothetical protein VE621_04230 [Bryobacteraceae bacterium]|nr:hypothetical protein [Bryobacteraceae bacterium]